LHRIPKHKASIFILIGVIGKTLIDFCGKLLTFGQHFTYLWLGEEEESIQHKKP